MEAGMERITVLGGPSIFRAGLVDLLLAFGFGSVDEARDLDHLRCRLAETPPRKSLIIALARDDQDAISTLCEIKSLLWTAKIVYLASEFDFDAMRGCLAAGACGYVLSNISRDALKETLQLVSAGEKVFPTDIELPAPVRAAEPETLEPVAAEPALSGREIDILQRLASGQSNRAIARELRLAEAELRVHLGRILRKANAMNRTQAALWALMAGFGAPPKRIEKARLH
jgi:two-component system nitrate/nitrite response regulator NarL